MKHYVTIGLICCITLSVIACHNHKHNDTQTISYSFPDVLTIDSANKMIGSYLTSINYQNNDTDTRSIIINAKLLRLYLDSVTNSSSIAYVKIMFAHKLSYINAGNGNIRAGYSNDALTFVITGLDTSGNYIYLPSNLVMDHGANCPSNCPPGTAAGSLLPTSTSLP